MVIMVVVFVGESLELLTPVSRFLQLKPMQRAGMILVYLGVQMFYQRAAPTGLEGVVLRILGVPLFYQHAAPTGLEGMILRIFGGFVFLPTCRPRGA